jgi:hypothetical protein
VLSLFAILCVTGVLVLCITSLCARDLVFLFVDAYLCMYVCFHVCVCGYVRFCLHDMLVLLFTRLKFKFVSGCLLI